MTRGFNKITKKNKDNINEFNFTHNTILALLGFAIQRNDDELKVFIEDEYIRSQFDYSDSCLFRSFEFDNLVDKGKSWYEKIYNETLAKEIQDQKEAAEIDDYVREIEFNKQHEKEWAEDPSNPANWYDD